VALQFSLSAIKVVFLHSKPNCLLFNQSVTSARVLNCLLPLQVQLVALLVKAFEFLSSLVKLNLGSLGLCNLLFQLSTFTAYLNGELFNLKSEFLYLGFVGASVLLESEVVFLLLPSCKRPLL